MSHTLVCIRRIKPCVSALSAENEASTLKSIWLKISLSFPLMGINPDPDSDLAAQMSLYLLIISFSTRYQCSTGTQVYYYLYADTDSLLEVADFSFKFGRIYAGMNESSGTPFLIEYCTVPGSYHHR